jgi:hypothetical protein
MKAFVVRPFGTKGGINFDMHQRLIGPALSRLDIQGDTTEDAADQALQRVLSGLRIAGLNAPRLTR